VSQILQSVDCFTRLISFDGFSVVCQPAKLRTDATFNYITGLRRCRSLQYPTSVTLRLEEESEIGKDVFVI
jgi:hypothetical protein